MKKSELMKLLQEIPGNPWIFRADELYGQEHVDIVIMEKNEYGNVIVLDFKPGMTDSERGIDDATLRRIGETLWKDRYKSTEQAKKDCYKSSDEVINHSHKLIEDMTTNANNLIKKIEMYTKEMFKKE